MEEEPTRQEMRNSNGLLPKAIERSIPNHVERITHNIHLEGKAHRVTLKQACGSAKNGERHKPAA